METLVILSAFSCIGTCAQLIHRQSNRLVCLFRKCAKTHGSCHKMLHDRADRFYLINIDRCSGTLEIEEITDKDSVRFLIYQLCKFLILLVITSPCCQLKRSDGLRIPRMKYPVFTIMELSEIRQEIRFSLLGESSIVHNHCISGNRLQTYTSNRRDLRSEIGFEQTLRQTYRLEYLRPTIRTNGRDTHLRHDFQQSLLHRLDIIGFGSIIILLHFLTLHQIIEYGKYHVGTKGRRAISQ